MKLSLFDNEGKFSIYVVSDDGKKVFYKLSNQFMKTVDDLYNIDLYEITVDRNEIVSKLYEIYCELNMCTPYEDYEGKYLHIKRNMNDYMLCYSDGVHESSRKLNIKDIHDSKLIKFRKGVEIK